MRLFSTLFALCLLAVPAAWAASEVASVGALPDRGQVTLTGTVQQVDNERQFILRDSTGSVPVRMLSGPSVVIKPGDSVTVTGAVEQPLWGLLGKDISATGVDVHKDLASALSDAVTQATGVTLESAPPEQVSQLPDRGMVKLTGHIARIADNRNFTLRDPTGSIHVSVESDENIMLTRGAQVAVLGYVSKNLFGKELHATRVIVLAQAQPPSPAMNRPSDSRQ